MPNKLDPFLRPLLVHVLNGSSGLYGYGMEKSFTPGQLRRLLESAGFRVTRRTGVLFIPGWLRMLELWLPHAALAGSRDSPLRRFASFAWLYRQVPAVRRHGYLTVCVAERRRLVAPAPPGPRGRPRPRPPGCYTRSLP